MARGRPLRRTLSWMPHSRVTVVGVRPDYPFASVYKNMPISIDLTRVTYVGGVRDRRMKGGRLVNWCGQSLDFRQARDRAYRRVHSQSLSLVYRNDIGMRHVVPKVAVLVGELYVPYVSEALKVLSYHTSDVMMVTPLPTIPAPPGVNTLIVPFRNTEHFYTRIASHLKASRVDSVVFLQWNHQIPTHFCSSNQASYTCVRLSKDGKSCTVIPLHSKQKPATMRGKPELALLKESLLYILRTFSKNVSSHAHRSQSVE